MLTLACVYGLIVSGKVLLDIVKTRGEAMRSKKRTKPPSCLEDPSLGTHGYAHLENIRMHFVSNGDEDKPLMLLVHGFPEFWYSWRYQLREFKDKYRVVAVDLRGYGESDKPSGMGNYAVPVLVNDLKQIVTSLGYNKCVLVGHDWGGALAWYFANSCPDLVSKLIIMNCPNGFAFEKHLQTSFTQFKMSWYMMFFQLPWLPELFFRLNDFGALDRMMKEGKMGVNSEFLTAEDLEAYKYTFARGGFTCPINYYRYSLSLEGLSRGVGRKKGDWNIRMPTLIIWGDKDSALEKSLAQMSAEVCTNEVEIKYIEGASHWVQMDRPDLVNTYMRKFLDA